MNRRRLLERRGGYDPDHVSVAVTFSLAHEQLADASPEAGDLLRLCAFLAADAIPEELLDEGTSALGNSFGFASADELSRNEMIRHARRFALLDRDRDDRTLTVHRLVQEVVREGMPTAEQSLWAGRAISVIDFSFPTCDYCTWPACSRLLPHAVAAIQHAKRLGQSSLELARLLNCLGLYLMERAAYEQSEIFFNESLALYRDLAGEDHPNTAVILNNIGLSLECRGLYNEAMLNYEAAVLIRDSCISTDQLEQAKTLENLAFSLFQAGAIDRAIPTYIRVLNIQITLLDSNHPDLALTHNNLGLLYESLEQYDLAEECFRKALAGVRRTHEAHPDTAAALHNLAGLCLILKKYDEAEALYQESLSMRTDLLGDNHPDVATSAANLAALYLEYGDRSRAEPYYRMALHIRERVFGSEHESTAVTQNNLGLLLGNMGQFEEAERLLLSSLRIRENILGTMHADLLTVLSNLSALFQRMSRLDEAKHVDERILEIESATCVTRD